MTGGGVKLILSHRLDMDHRFSDDFKGLSSGTSVENGLRPLLGQAFN